MTMTNIRQVTTREEMIELGNERGLELFRTLPAATLQEMAGEYHGFMLRQDTEEAAERMRQFMAHWKGKAYRVTGDGRGEGYNWWLEEGQTVRHMRFATDIHTSNLDGEPVLRMRYAAFDNGPAKVDLVDEIRRVHPGLYLCIATTRAEDGTRNAPSVFGLMGPERDWIGVDDPDRERAL